jgi:hypothetical protein
LEGQGGGLRYERAAALASERVAASVLVAACDVRSRLLILTDSYSLFIALAGEIGMRQDRRERMAEQIREDGCIKHAGLAGAFGGADHPGSAPRPAPPSAP